MKKILILIITFLFLPTVAFAHPFLPQYHSTQGEYLDNKIQLTISFSPDQLKTLRVFNEVDTNKNDNLDKDELKAWAQVYVNNVDVKINGEKFELKAFDALTTFNEKKDFVEDPQKSQYADLISISYFDYTLKDEFLNIEVKNNNSYDGSDIYGFLPIVIDGYDSVCSETPEINYFINKFAKSNLADKYNCESKGVVSTTKPVSNNEKDVRGELLQFVKNAADNPLSIFVLILFSFLYGLQHAFLPGHAKTLIVVGGVIKKKKKDYIGLILATILSHTGSDAVFAFLIIFSTEKLKNVFNENVVNNFLGVFVGVVVIVSGLWLVFKYFNRDSHIHSDTNLEESKKTNKSLIMYGILSGITPSLLAISIVVYSYVIGRLYLGVISLIAFTLGFTTVILLLSYSSEKIVKRLQKVNKKFINKLLEEKTFNLLTGILITIVGIITILQYVKI